jgi:general secretion pathway protein I
MRLSSLSVSANRPQNQRGFTLIEVMMAMLVFVSVALIQQEVTASTVSQYLSVRHKILSSWIAENKITELQLSKSLPSAKEYKEDIEFADEDWQLISKVTTTANPDINQVEVVVFHVDPNSGEKSQKLTLSSFLGRY